jgi:hypothetical protein
MKFFDYTCYTNGRFGYHGVRNKRLLSTTALQMDVLGIMELEIKDF